MHAPYTYLIEFIPTGQLYYGVRTKKGCCTDDLFEKYFTSSKVVKSLIAQYGIGSFRVLTITSHESCELAREFEELVLVDIDAARSDKWLNRHNGGKNFYSPIGMNRGRIVSTETREKLSKIFAGKYAGELNPNYGKLGKESPSYGYKHSHEHRIKMSERFSGKNNPMYGTHRSEETRKKQSDRMSGCNNPIYGTHRSEETKEKLRASNLGKKLSEETKSKMKLSQMNKDKSFYKKGESNHSSKEYIITFPDGNKRKIIGLHNFCNEYNLCSSAMIKVAKGKNKQHKGFRCDYFNVEIDL